MVIGIDLDNTIILYDRVIHQVAVARGLIDPSLPVNKTTVRDTLRKHPNGEGEWQKIQRIIYTTKLSAAELAPGFVEFIKQVRQQKIPAYIVSHKTEFSPVDPSRTNLRTAALQWIERHNFFSPQGLGFSREEIFFEATRSEKISRIKLLRCTVFIDDLIEVFDEPAFPGEVKQILFSNSAQASSNRSVCTKWEEIRREVFKMS